MKIDVAITNDNRETEVYRFIDAIDKFNFFFTQIKNINNKTNEPTIIIANKKDGEKQIKWRHPDLAVLRPQPKNLAHIALAHPCEAPDALLLSAWRTGLSTMY